MPRSRLSRFLVATSFVLATAAIGACASSEPDATTGSPGSTEGSSVAAPADLYRTDEIHSIEVTFDQAAYEDLIAAYADSRSKEWMEAEVTIDGTTFSKAGMRLKGNSSLMSLSGSGFPGMGAGTAPTEGGGTEAPAAASESPETLPWLIRLDKYVDGQNLGGVTELVVRSSSMESALNEALALDLLAEIGLASQKATYAGFTANGSDPALRLVIENPNDEWDAENFDGSGILYKSEASGNWTYRGDDPDAYKDVFDQETRTDDADLEPLMAFLDFLNNSDDATFAAELPDRLDVEAFADYLAFEDLIGNFDDIDGPGNNSYLRYDEDTDQFTVVAWDHNLAFGGMALMLRGGNGGPGGPPGSLPPGLPSMPEGAGTPPADLPEGFPPGGFPEGGIPEGGIPEGGGPGGFPAGIGQNPLVNRFKANPELQARYDAALAEQKERLFTSGLALERLTSWADLLTRDGADLIDPATVDADVATIEAVINA